MQVRVFAQEVEINSALRAGVENELARIAALRHVVRSVNYYDAGKPRHHSKISENVPSVPEFPPSFRMKPIRVPGLLG